MRKYLSEILRKIDCGPGICYRIPVRGRVVAELRSPSPARRKNPGATMLTLALEMKKLSSPTRGKADGLTATNFKQHLYGKKPFAGPQKNPNPAATR